MERNCEKCVYHTEDGCEKWECLGTTTIEDIKQESYNEGFEKANQLIKPLMQKIHECVYKQGCIETINKFIEEVSIRLDWDNELYTLAIKHCIDIALNIRKELEEEK